MAKKNKAKLPKRIAGVKIPKTLRKSAPALGAFLATPAGREAVAAGLVAMAGALAGTKQGRHAVAAAGDSVADASTTAVGTLSTLGEATVAAAGEVARAVLPSSGGEAGKHERNSAVATHPGTVRTRKIKDSDKLAKH